MPMPTEPDKHAEPDELNNFDETHKLNNPDDGDIRDVRYVGEQRR